MSDNEYTSSFPLFPFGGTGPGGGGPGGRGPGGGGPGGKGPPKVIKAEDPSVFPPSERPTLGADISPKGDRLDTIGQTFSAVGSYFNDHQTEIGVVVAGVVLIGTAEVWIPATVAAAGAVAAEGLIAEGAIAASSAIGANVIAFAASPQGKLAASLLAGGLGGMYSGSGSAAQATTEINDPLLLDLNGDGVKTTNFANAVFFDHDSNGFAEESTWVDDNDGILVVDKNGNGIIDNGQEIIGDGATNSDGYAALSSFDTNKDGIVDSKDSLFQQLNILKGDGSLLTLQQAGISSISLSHTDTGIYDTNWNTQFALGSFTKTDGTKGQMGEYNLLSNTAISIATTTITIPTEIAALPNALGSGNVYDLQQAMALDTSGQLKMLIETFIGTSDTAEQNQLLDQILLKWSGIDYSSIADRHGYSNPVHMAIVEQFEGQAYHGDSASFIPMVPASYMSQYYYELSESLYAKLMAETQLQDYFSVITWTQNSVTGSYSLNLDAATQKIEQLATTNRSAALQIAGEFSRALNGLKWSLVSNYESFYRAMTALGSDFKFTIDTADKVILNGTSGDDYLTAPDTSTAGKDYRAMAIYAGAGNDELIATYNADILSGGTGNDTLEGKAGNDTYLFSRGDGQDTIIEGNQSDFLPNADGGFDVLHFGSGIAVSDLTFREDTNSNLIIQIKGSTDQITVSKEFAADQLGSRVEAFVLADGTTYTWDQIYNTMLQNPGSNNITGTSGDDTLYGTAETSQLITGLAGNDYLTAGPGDDTLDGDDGNDVLQGNAGNATLLGGNGDDTLNSYSDAGKSNYLSGGAGNDTLYGSMGNDTLDAGSGDDYVYDYGGNTTYLINSGFGQDRIEDTGGTDVVKFGANLLASNAVFSGDFSNNLSVSFKGTTDLLTITSHLNGGSNVIEAFTFADGTTYAAAQIIGMLQNVGTSGMDNLTGSSYAEKMFGYAGDDQLYGYAGNDTVDAGDGNDFLDGGDGDDSLMGGTGNDSIYGEAGNDTLNGGSGGDSMLGGTGNDTYIVDSTADVIYEYAGEGTDLVQSSVSYTLGDNLENLTLTGTAAINATGNTLNNVITGNSGNNILDGGSGIDTLKGGLGNDTYIVDSTKDTITENTGEGTDTVQSTVSYTLGNNLENLTLTGTAAINGAGNALYNVLTGNTGNNSLTGGAGDDTLNGGNGMDTLVGGIGNDTYIVDSTTDVITENANEGTDLVQASVTYTLGANLENLTLTGTAAINGTGNTLNNVLTGNAGNNILDGGAGIDTLSGGLGNDTYIVGSTTDTIIENASAGTDLVQSSVTYTLGTNLENLTLTGTAAINGTGNTLNNLLTGNSGNNVLDGNTGVDTLVGGLGNDTYIVDSTTDTITENANEGTDLVQSSVSYALGNNLENLTLIGTAAINGTGNALNNLLTGNGANNILTGAAGDDTLDGGAGVDTLVGGLGNDTYTVDSTTDTITENASEGTDLVQSSVTYTLGNNLENLTLTGTTAINGTGNSLNNIITGNSGNNVLTGGAGVDTLIGGLGDDTYVVDTTTDVITEAASAGTDTVKSSVTYTLGANLENLTLTGTTAINGTGNSLNNVLTGNSANNNLTGGAGDDTLNGGSGIDTLVGGTGNDMYIVNSTTDVITENASEGTDLVQSSVTYTLGNNLENLTLTGTAAINGTGNTLNNVLTGNSAANSLSAGTGNDTLNGGTGNDTLIGGTGNDFYLFNKGDGLDLIQENDTTAGNTDHLQFNSAITKAQIAIFKNGNNLEIGYQGDTTDKITVTNQFTTAGQVERYELSTGQYMTNADVNLVIQNMNSYASSHGISITSLSTVQNNQNLLNIVAAGWHN